MYLSGHKILPKILQRYCRLIYHCDIPVTADIAPDAYFCHNAFGVVINPNAVIGGGGTTIQHSVTIGELNSHDAPIIGESVYIGARAIILGDIHIGNNAKIGAGALVLKDVPEGCTAVGVPARIIKKEGE